jgi:hypothetical protein
VRNWTHEEAQAHLEAAWLAGARSLDNWHRKQTQRPVGHGILAVTIKRDPKTGMETVVRASEGIDGTLPAGFSIVSTDDGQGEVLTIPALNSSEPRPRPKVGEYVRLMVLRDCFQIVLKVGDIGQVSKDDGGLLMVRWFTGDMWIDQADVAVVES